MARVIRRPRRNLAEFKRQVLAELREQTLAAAREPGGTTCPTCDQHAQVYRWSLYATAIRAAVLYHWLGRGRPDRFVHTRELKAAGHTGQGDANRLRHWGLVERDDRSRDDGGKSGYWRSSELLRQFLRGLATLPKYVYTYNNEVVEVSEERVTIHDCLGDFSYDEVVRGVHAD